MVQNKREMVQNKREMVQSPRPKAYHERRLGVRGELGWKSVADPNPVAAAEDPAEVRGDL